jgi:hypothetical protein
MMRGLAFLMLLLAVVAVPVSPGAAGGVPPAPGTGEPEEAPDEFVPSEQVRVDNEVSFPVDI